MDKKDQKDFLKLLNPENCTFSKGDTGLLRVEIHEEICALQVVLKRLFPIRYPSKYISVSDGKQEVGIIEDLKTFDSATRKMIETDLDHFYAVPLIKEVLGIKSEHGFYRWQTITDRGECDFYVKGRSESVRATAEGQVFVTDINNCRYVIPDLSELPASSRAKLQIVL